MSIIYCQGCDNSVDTDFQECHEHEDELICNSCYENLEFINSDDIVNMINSHKYELEAKQTALSETRGGM